MKVTKKLVVAVAAAMALGASAETCVFYCESNMSSPVNFTNATYWEGGSVPSSPQDDIVIMRPPAGATTKITVSSAINAASIDIGAGTGQGNVEITFSTAPSAPSVFSGDVYIRAGTLITHTAGGVSKIGTTVNYSVNIQAGGKMTIEQGASIDVTKKGHVNENGPQGTGYTNAAGGSHGGMRSGGKSAYDSALEPCMYGSSAGSGVVGPGVIRLVAGGELRVDGTVTAAGSNGTGYGSSAGGAIWITAGWLSGAATGVISVNGGTSKFGPGSSGGRIAVYQTHSSATDFSRFLGTISAYGGRTTQGSTTSGRAPGAAGTIYLQSYGQTPMTATLIVDNYSVRRNNSPLSDAAVFIPITPLSAAYDCGVIGNLILRNGAHVDISSATVQVYGNISVSDSRFKSYAGTLELCGSADTTITGTGTYCNVSCSVPGKRILFGTGTHDEFRIADGATLSLNGTSGNPIVLAPATQGESWKIKLAQTAASDVSNVSVSHSDASGGISITANSSTDGGGNANWSFPKSFEPGDTLTWNGSYSDRWTDVANWTDKFNASRLPVETDVIVIPAGCSSYPIIAANTLQNSISVAQGASLTISNGAALTVTNSFTVSGSLAMTDRESIDFPGKTLTFAPNSFSPARSSFTVSGDLAQTIDLGGNTFMYLYVRKTDGSVAFTDGFSADLFDVLATSSLSLSFSDGVEAAARNVACRSRVEAVEPAALLTLTSAGAWSIRATASQYFSGVRVANCTATGLAATADSISEDLGGNVNWTFATDAATAAEWVGGTGDFDTAANWYPAVVPGSGTDVLITGINGASAVTASGDVTVRSILVGTGTSTSSLRVNGLLTTSSDLVVGTNGTLTLTAPLADNVVGRDFILRRGATATHPVLPDACDTLAQADSSGYRFRVSAVRDVVVESGAKLNVSSKGYSAEKGPLGKNKWVPVDIDGDGTADRNYSIPAGGHASVCITNNAYLSGLCYGSMFEPLSHGSGGEYSRGGGAVRLAAGRNMTIDGTITANSADESGYTCSAAGGSIWLTAQGSLSGNGSLSARAGSSVYGSLGSGGRIALYANELLFGGTISAPGGRNNSESSTHHFSGNGTVLKKTISSPEYDVTVDNDQYRQMGQYLAWPASEAKMAEVTTDWPSKDDDARKSLFKFVRVNVGHLTALNLRYNLKMLDLAVNVNTGSYVRLNGNTLRVFSSAHKNATGWAGTYEDGTRLPGAVVWGANGVTITVR